MARDISLSHLIKPQKSSNNILTRMSINRGTENGVCAPTTYVVAEIIPQEWFPGINSVKTKRQKKTFSPVYNVDFHL